MFHSLTSHASQARHHSRQKTIPAFALFILLVLTPSLTPALHGAIIRVEDVKGGSVLGKMLDEGTTKKGETYFYYGKDLTADRAEAVSIDREKGFAILKTSGISPKAGDVFVDKDWFVVIALLDRGGDIETVSRIVKDLPGDTAFPSLETNSLEGFKMQVGAILASRLSQVERMNKSGDASSLFMLHLTAGDFEFKYNSDYARARDHYLAGLKAYPKLGSVQARAMVKTGDCELNLKNFSEAMEWYKRGLSKLKEDPELFKNEIRSTEVKLSAIQKVLGGGNASPASPNSGNSQNQNQNAATTPTPAANKEPASTTVPSGLRAALVAEARRLLNTTWGPNDVYKGKTFLFDCQGTVARIYWSQGIDVTKGYDRPEFARLNGGVPRIFYTYKGENRVSFSKRPGPGDIVFFDNTWDANGDARWNDPMTHVGIVEDVDPDGTVSVIHHCSSGIKRYKLNLEKPTIYQDESGKVLNSFIRRQSANDPKGTSYVMGSYWAGFATPGPN